MPDSYLYKFLAHSTQVAKSAISRCEIPDKGASNDGGSEAKLPMNADTGQPYRR